eukprot:s441_g2.t1
MSTEVEGLFSLFGKVQQQSAAAAAAAAEVAQRAAAAMAKNSSAGFPKMKNGSSNAAEAHPPPEASAAACGSEKAQKESQMPVEPKVTGASRKRKQRERLPELVKKWIWLSLRPHLRYDAMEAAVDRAYEDDEFSVSETESFPSELPGRTSKHAPGLAACLLHTRVDFFLDAGKTYARVYEDD